jgi:hypothetical protein
MSTSIESLMSIIQSGHLLTEKIDGSISLAQLSNSKNKNQTEFVLKSLLQAFPLSFSKDIENFNFWTSASDETVRALALAYTIQMEEKGIQNSSYLGYCSMNKNPILEFPERTTLRTFSSDRSVQLPPVRILHSDRLVSLHSDWKTLLPKFELSFLREASFFMDSDIIIDSTGAVFLDLGSFDGSAYIDFRHDSKLAGVTSKQAVVSKSIFEVKEEARFTGVFWLGHPLGFAWGHWVYEFLTRLSLFNDSKVSDSVPILVSNLIPEKFIDFAKILWPENEFIKLPTGQKVKLTNSYFINSPVCYPHGIFEIAKTPVDHISCEIIGMESLRNRINVTSHNLFGSNSNSDLISVHLARNNANNIKSKNELILKEIAKSHGITSLDPGILSPVKEIELFSRLKFAFGNSGSQMIGTTFGAENSRVLLIGHDLIDHDSRGFNWVLRNNTNKEADAVLGTRDSSSIIRSEHSYHQDFNLSEQAINYIDDTVLERSKS